MPLTTTSYAILGLLDIRDWSAYDLVQQANRSLAFVWPVSESQLYAEPKRLAREGLIEILEEPAGPVRSRQVYTITEAGRTELRAWLRTEPALPRVQVEALLRCLLAPSGDKDDLLRALRSTREGAEALYGRGAELLDDLVGRGDRPFPERLHANVLWMSFVGDLLRLVARWADFAESEVDRWDDAATGADAEHLEELLRALAAGNPPRRA